MDITDILSTLGLLDADGYLVPPGHPNVRNMTKRLYALVDLQEGGTRLTAEEDNQLDLLQQAFDYYNDMVEEEAAALDERSDDSYEPGKGDEASSSEDYSGDVVASDDSLDYSED